jgi:hypothetical protein
MIYCYLLDSTCIEQPPKPDAAETSFSQAGKMPEARLQSVKIWTGSNVKNPGCRGTVNCSWTKPGDSAHISTFTFMYVDHDWKTVGFDFPPKQLATKSTQN